MSLPTAIEAIQLANQVRENISRKIEQDIDKDVQNIITRIETLIKATEPNENNIYTLEILIKDIIYEDKQIVLNKLTNMMIKQNYKVTIEKKSYFFNNCFILNFRPMTEDEVYDVERRNGKKNEDI